MGFFNMSLEVTQAPHPRRETFAALDLQPRGDVGLVEYGDGDLLH